MPNISITKLSENPVTFFFLVLFSSNQSFNENVHIYLLICLLTPAWMFRETTTHVMPLDSSGSMQSGWHQQGKYMKPCLHVATLILFSYRPQAEGISSFAGTFQPQAVIHEVLWTSKAAVGLDAVPPRSTFCLSVWCCWVSKVNMQNGSSWHGRTSM